MSSHYYSPFSQQPQPYGQMPPQPYVQIAPQVIGHTIPQSENQIVNPMLNYGTDMIVNEIVKSIILDNKIDINKFLKTIFGTVVTKYVIENATKFIMNILQFPNEVFNIFINHYSYIKTYIKYFIFTLLGKYKIYKYNKFNLEKIEGCAESISNFIEKDNIRYRVGLPQTFFIRYFNDFSKYVIINFKSISYNIVSNSDINEYNKYMDSLKVNNEVLIGSSNSSKYVYELDVYKNLGNMITEFITLNKKIDRNGCSMMFCFMGKSGTGKTQFCYYVNNLKLCDRIIRLNLINTGGQFTPLDSLLKHTQYQLLNSNVIFIEELDRYFDDLLTNKLSINKIKGEYRTEKEDNTNLLAIVDDERKNDIFKKLQNFINTLHLLADGELLPYNNIIIINSNNLQSIYTKLAENGIKKTVIDALKSRIQIIEFKMPAYKDICDITHDIFKKCEKNISYDEVKEIIPIDINMCYRTFDSKIVLSHGNPQRLKQLLLEKPEDIIIPEFKPDNDINTHIKTNDDDDAKSVKSYDKQGDYNNPTFQHHYNPITGYSNMINENQNQYNHNGILMNNKEPRTVMQKQIVQESVQVPIIDEYGNTTYAIQLIEKEIEIPAWTTDY